MAWWIWLLIAWPVLAGAVAIGLGMAIRAAERRELGRDRPGESAGLDERDVA